MLSSIEDLYTLYRNLPPRFVEYTVSHIPRSAPQNEFFHVCGRIGTIVSLEILDEPGTNGVYLMANVASLSNLSLVAIRSVGQKYLIGNSEIFISGTNLWYNSWKKITLSDPGTHTHFYELVESLKQDVYLPEDLERHLSSLLEDFKPSNQSAINVAAFIQDLCSSSGHTCQEFIDGIYTLLSSNHPQIAAETTRLLNWLSMDVPASTKLRLARANLVDHILSALSQNSTLTWDSYLAYPGFLSFLSSLFVRTCQGHRAGRSSHQYNVITSKRTAGLWSFSDMDDGCQNMWKRSGAYNDERGRGDGHNKSRYKPFSSHPGFFNDHQNLNGE
ncbi:hypothetical protein BLNAU_6937 [Blattamonas nauphoetae]|uniref:Uncharacterized protein n=1 Tax=Blattamonas nauphoetae TaxID=2049346 RepID=A0ABQ9Y2Q7_9EUKA|nr:hypothetical protein BLNAU_6937 [Blattamonas nauphoetae]